jgi:SAM-dependent methyltransferase
MRWMAKDFLFRQVILIVPLLFFIYGVYGQDGSLEPDYGQEGKDVIWVPTSQALVEKMLDIAQITKDDFVMDLGSGDGRLVISAAKRGARGLGIEYNPDLVKVSRENASNAGVNDKASFREADIFETDLSQATVITLFLLPKLNLELRPSLLELKPGTRIVSNTFHMGDWKPDEKVTVTEGCNGVYCEALLWIVPAKVEGNWKVDQNELILEQKFQEISGTFDSLNLTDGHINGYEISFKVNGYFYKGTVSGNEIHGSVSSGSGIIKEWTADLQ